MNRNVQNPERLPVSKSLLYPAAGALLAMGAPVGLLLLRLLAPGHPARLTVQAALGEIARDAQTYVYLTVSTTLVFVVLGVLLGRQTDRLEESSLTDPLTGLPNRRHFEARLAAELKRAKRQDAPLCLLLIDVDHLKRINDIGGHKLGDIALRAVADAIAVSRRGTDVAARWGGDEFMLLAPGTDAAGGLSMAARIREALSRAQRGPGASTPTVSIGVADAAPLESVTLEGLCAAADTALYEAKSAGRDRARVSTRAP